MTEDPGRTYAVVVGVEHYDDDKWDLDGPVPNACQFVSWLVKRGVPPANIFFLASPIEANAPLLSTLGPRVVRGNATRDGFETTFTREVSKKRGDLLFVFWGGHGMADEEDKRRLLYANARPEDMLNASLEQVLLLARYKRFAGLRRQIFIVDSCANRYLAKLDAATLPSSKLSQERTGTPNAQYVLLATSMGQVAINTGKTGLFSASVLEALEQQDPAVWPPDMDRVKDLVWKKFDHYRKHGGPDGQPVQQRPIDVQSTDWDGNRDVLPMEPAAPKDGPGAYIYCDRRPQVLRFRSFFRPPSPTSAAPPSRGCIIVGDMRESPDSLVKRLQYQYLGPEMKRLKGELALPPDREVEWPSPTLPLDELQRDLKVSIRLEFGGTDDVVDPTSDQLLALEAFRAPMVVVRHTIPEADWAGRTIDLLRWYLTKYWVPLSTKPGAPRVVVFVTLRRPSIYQRQNVLTWLRWQKDTTMLRWGLRGTAIPARQIQASGCHSVILDELRPVTVGDVTDWLNEYLPGAYPLPKDRMSAAQRIVGTEPDATRYMSDVESALRDELDKAAGSRFPLQAEARSAS